MSAIVRRPPGPRPPRRAAGSAAAAALALALLPGALRAQAPEPARADTVARTGDARAPRDTLATRAARLDSVRVTARRDPRPGVTRLTLPAAATVTADRVRATVNVVDAQDAVKYLPSLFLRKRNNGDTQATMATRTWGVGSSARSLVFADGVPLSALVANNNTIGAPRWGLVDPAEVERVDVMYGPFSAAYAGNSMGAVLEMTTRMPEGREGTVGYTHAAQAFGQYGTRRTFQTLQPSVHVGDRVGRFAFWAGGSYMDSHSQPLAYVTSATFPAGTAGGYAATNKLGAPANVLGAGGLLHTRMTTARLKAAYDLTPTLRAAYTLGLWRNDADADVETYASRGDQPTFAGLGAFATNAYALAQRHSSQSLSLRTTNPRGSWDYEVVGTRYRFDRDDQRTPGAAPAVGTAFGAAGRLATLTGTGWSTADARVAWHPGGVGAARHTVSAGVHADGYRLENPTYAVADWRAERPARGAVLTEGDGRTRTRAVWAQDSWQVVPALRLTVGGRYEWWRGFDGYNANGATAVRQPAVRAERFSPKAVLAWAAAPAWTLTGSVARAYRFATAAELYQLVSTGPTFTSPDPNLRPDNVLAAELRAERATADGRVQLAVFQDDVRDAILSQFLPLVPDSPTLYAYVANVDRVRSRGVELTAERRGLFAGGRGGGGGARARGLDVAASATYLDARTLALSGRASATAPAGSAVGKFLPNIPRWRASATATYHAGERTALTLAGRYSTKLWTTLDNADVRPNVFQGFGEWFVADAKASRRVGAHWSASLGVDNLLDRKYFLFHPFPQRTAVAQLQYGF